MKMFSQNKHLTHTIICVLGLLATTLSGSSQTYEPTNWVNDPFCYNQNFALAGGDAAIASFTNNGVQCGTLYAHSPIGSPLRMENPGDAIAFTGQAVIVGEINPDGDLQFRIGLYYRGDSASDTNWLGYTVGNFAGGSTGETALMVRNNPNPGSYSSGMPGNAMRPECANIVFSPSWGAGTYDFSLSVTVLPDKKQKISWKLSGVSPSTYNQSGEYINSFPLTSPPVFDYVGIMGGAALFRSASTSDNISLKNVKVNLTKGMNSK